MRRTDPTTPRQPHELQDAASYSQEFERMGADIYSRRVVAAACAKRIGMTQWLCLCNMMHLGERTRGQAAPCILAFMTPGLLRMADKDKQTNIARQDDLPPDQASSFRLPSMLGTANSIVGQRAGDSGPRCNVL